MMTDAATKTTDRTRELLERDARHNCGLWQPDTVFVRGDGVYLWDADGRKYLDFMAGIAVASLGHAHPRLTRAIAEQAERLLVCPQNLANDARTDFVEKLVTMVPDHLQRVFLANSGAEANEAALKWARASTGRSRFVAAKRGFSGRTLGALSLTWEPKYRLPFAPLPLTVDFVPFNDVAALGEAIGPETAAIFLEPVQGEGGIHLATSEFLATARSLSRRHGALLIFDEVQSGCGRTGKFLASEHYGVDADMVTLAKGLGGGVPIGALLMTEEVAAAMPKGGHGTTFGGNPLASAAGLAVLEEIESRELLEHVRRLGEYFLSSLQALRSRRIRDVRGLGLMIALELKEKAAPHIAALKDRGVLVINAGATVIRFVPPLIVTKEQVDEVIDHLVEVL